MLITGHEWYGRRIARAAGAYFNPECDVAIARIEGAELYGGVTYQGYTGEGGSIHMHIAGFRANWMCRDFLWMIFDYPFNQLDCRKVFGQIAKSNTRSLEIATRLGFKVEHEVEGVFPDGPCLYLGLVRENCRWLSYNPRVIPEA